MPYQRLKSGERAVFLGSGVVRVESRPELPALRGGRGEEPEASTRELVGAAVRVGAWESALDLVKVYWEAPVAAVKYRLISKIGVRPPARGYYPRLDKRERGLAVERAAVGTRMGFGEADLPWVEAGKRRKTRDERRRLRIQETMVGEARRIAERGLSQSKHHAIQIEKVINDFKLEQADDSKVEGIAIRAIGAGAENILNQAFIAGQTATDLSRLATDEEVNLAARCIQETVRSGRNWTEEDIKKWIMAELGRKALGRLVEVGVTASQANEYKRLDQLDLTSRASGADHLTEKVILDIHPLDPIIADALGAKGGNRNMLYGVRVTLGVGNRVYVKYMSKRDMVARSLEDLEVDVSMVRDAGAVQMVRRGDFGGRKLRGFVDWILGNRHELPLPGTLALGSIMQAELGAKPIPMLNPDLAYQTITVLQGASKALTERKLRIREANPLVDLPPKRVKEEVKEMILRGVRTLPNCGKVAGIVERTKSGVVTVRDAPGMDFVKSMFGVEMGRDLAERILKEGEKGKVKKGIRSAYSDEQGREMIRILMDRALGVLMASENDARAYVEGMRGMRGRIKAAYPTEWREITGQLDMKCRVLLGLS